MAALASYFQWRMVRAVRAPAALLLGLWLAACGGGSDQAAPIVISASDPPAGRIGDKYPGFAFTVASGGTAPFTYSESGPLPPGLSLDSHGTLSGYPTRAGTYTFMVTATDSSLPPMTGLKSATISISDTQLFLTGGTSPPAGIVTHPYDGYWFQVNGGSPPLLWSVASGQVPPGLTLDSGGGLTGTPTTVGSWTFTLKATDSAQTPESVTTPSITVVINAPGPIKIDPTQTPPNGTNGAAYSFAFVTTGGYLPLSWSLTAGALPPGLKLGSDGSLTGTPTTAGSFNFTVTVTDSGAPPSSDSLATPTPVTIVNPPPPVIASAEPPTATVNAPYQPFQFTANGGLAPLVWSESGTMGGLGLSLDGILSGTPTTAGHFPITVTVRDALSRISPDAPFTVRVSLARPPAAFTLTPGNMSKGRAGHAATLLLTGKVLVTGGKLGGNASGGNADPTAELYDPGTGTFSLTTGNMTEARSGHTATLLKLSSSGLKNYGKVLIVGPVDTTAELYDPAAGTFAATGSMTHPRTSPTATLLKTDKVLIVGGNTTAGDLTAELYDPATGTFSDTGSTTILRAGHTATRLLDGRVLIAGGGGGATAAELYDPALGTFTPTTGSMTEARTGHTATLLGSADGAQNGSVLIIGPDGSAELYEPSTETFARVGSLQHIGSLSVAATASLRNDGTVLVAGGAGSGTCRTLNGGYLHYRISLSDAELFAPESDGFTVTGSLNVPRDTDTATVLLDGSVLVIGGYRHPTNCLESYYNRFVLSSAEVFK